MIHPKEKRANDLEALESVKLEQMIEALRDPKVSEDDKATIRARLRKYRKELDTEIQSCTSKLNSKHSGRDE